MNSILYVVGYCPSCGTGPLGVRICGQCGQATVMCEECDVMWLGEGRCAARVFPRQPDVPCPACDASLMTSPAHWAVFDELEATGWADRIVDVGTALSDSAGRHDEHARRADAD